MVENFKRNGGIIWRGWIKMYCDRWQWIGTGPIYPARGPFYCGINKLMPIPEFSIRLCSPTSTSKQLAVAGRFGGDNGIIIRLNNCGYRFGMKLRSFNCSWLSRFSAEDERLFFGGASRIQIEGIRNIKAKEDYGIYIKALYHFHCVINGSSVFHLSTDQDDDTVPNVTDLDYE